MKKKNFLYLLSLFLLTACEQQTSIPIDQKKNDQPIKNTIVNDQTPNPTIIDKLKESDKNIVADLGFSNPDETFDAAHSDPKSDAKQPFCLNLNTTGINQENEQALVETSCTAISKRLASISMQLCMDAKLRATHCESINGFPLLMSEFLPNQTPQGRILLIGGTHGDELTSVSIVFKWIEQLNKTGSGSFHWHIVPMVNPDGVLRKEATRTNQNGIDLNRNMPSNNWHEHALKYWKNKSNKDPRRYPGIKPNSEPETQWLVDAINQFQPDAIISVHAPYGIVDFDSHLLNAAPKNLGKLHLNLLGAYPGSLGNYAGINRNIPVITIELPHAWVMPSAKESRAIFDDIMSWLINNVRRNKPKINAH